jgi:hypothetical protein
LLERVSNSNSNSNSSLTNHRQEEYEESLLPKAKEQSPALPPGVHAYNIMAPSECKIGVCFLIAIVLWLWVVIVPLKLKQPPVLVVVTYK